MRFFQSAAVILALLQSSFGSGLRNDNREQKLRSTIPELETAKGQFDGVKSDYKQRFNGRVLGNGIVLEYNRYYHPEIAGPVVFLMTGRGSVLSQVEPTAKELASRGYIVISFEHFSYSSHKRDAKVTGPPNPDYPTHMYKTMQTSMEDIQWMIENHQGVFTRGLPNPSSVPKFAVAGVSMGGHAALLTFANNKDTIDAGFCFVCEGNYKHYMAEKFIPYQSKSSPVWDDWFPQELANDVTELDPSNHLSDFNNRPFLAINDYDDAQVPAIVNYEMIKRLRDLGHYSGSDHTKLHHEITRSGQGHSASKEKYLQKFAANWMEEHFPINRQSGVLSEGRYKIVVRDDIKSSYTVRQPFLYYSGSGYLRAAGWMVDNSWIDVQHIWEVSPVDNGYTIKIGEAYICADRSQHHTRNMAALGSKDWYWTPLTTSFSEYCVWQITEVTEKPGFYQIVNVSHDGKLLLSTDTEDHNGYTGKKLFTIPGHTQVLGDWENDLFSFHALSTQYNTVDISQELNSVSIE